MKKRITNNNYEDMLDEEFEHTYKQNKSLNKISKKKPMWRSDRKKEKKFKIDMQQYDN